MSNAVIIKESHEELGIFSQRFFHFMNLWTIYTDLLKGTYTPSLDDDQYPVSITMMLVLYAYFYSLVEDSNDGLNGFRVWRGRLPEEEAVIAVVEATVQPLLNHLRLFRNRLGFHGSRTWNRESAAFDLFNQHSGMDVFNAMKRFKAMNAALFGMDAKLQANDPAGIAHYRKILDKIAAS